VSGEVYPNGKTIAGAGIAPKFLIYFEKQQKWQVTTAKLMVFEALTVSGQTTIISVVV